MVGLIGFEPMTNGFPQSRPLQNFVIPIRVKQSNAFWSPPYYLAILQPHTTPTSTSRIIKTLRVKMYKKTK